MQSSALGTNATSMFLHRSPSGAQRRIRQRMGGEWPLQKSTLTNSNENLDSYDPSPSINPNQHPNSDSLGYRSLIESSDYRSLLVDDNFNSNPVKETIEDKLSNWSLSASLNKYNYSNDSSNSLNLSFGSSNNTKPIPAPRSQEQHSSPIQPITLNGRQRYNSGSSNKTPIDHSSFNFTGSPNLGSKLMSSSPDISLSQLPQSPIKPIVHVHPFPVPRSKPQPPPIPEKPKKLQTARLKSIEIAAADKSTSSISDFNLSQDFSNLDDEALIKMENQRIATLSCLYTKVSGRWEDLKTLHNEKKKNGELFQQTMEIAQRHGIPTTPFLRFVKRFEAVYEVQTRLVLNKQQLRKSLETTKDEEFLLPLIEQNELNTQDIERIVDELDTTFRTLDGQLCQVLEPEQHERWVFFVRTLYSLIAEQTSIQFKVRYVTEQIKKLEKFSFKQLVTSRSANTSISSDTKDTL